MVAFAATVEVAKHSAFKDIAGFLVSNRLEDGELETRIQAGEVFAKEVTVGGG